jgi:hypothetical protein
MGIEQAHWASDTRIGDVTEAIMLLNKKDGYPILAFNHPE